MKFCPMCGMPQLKVGVTVCQFCNYEEKPIEKLSKKQLIGLAGGILSLIAMCLVK